ncbi:uncharacterized protein LOC133626010 [Colius striatus]|uniref:uncharacterized protein LOC133626010 n=1 Tax=Colius striatus TaxID=57412 RepID=UPI002B1D0BD0|nr:uncharacterized protein LOC133626010 [Colius striatus]
MGSAGSGAAGSAARCVTPDHRTPPHLATAPIFNGHPPARETCAKDVNRVAAGGCAYRECCQYHLRWELLCRSAHKGCGTPTQVLQEGCHHPRSKFALQPLRDTLVLAHPGPTPQLVTPVALLPILQDITPLGPHHRDITPLGTHHRDITPLGTHHRDITPMGTHRRDITPLGPHHRDITPTGTHRHAPLTAIRSTRRSIIRRTRSTPSTMEASTQAAQAAVLTLTEEDVFHPHGHEVTNHEDERAVGAIHLLLHAFSFALSTAFHLPNGFLAFSWQIP